MIRDPDFDGVHSGDHLHLTGPDREDHLMVSLSTNGSEPHIWMTRDEVRKLASWLLAYLHS